MSSEQKTEQKIRKIFGYHLALDLYGCDPEAIRSVDNCYSYLDKLPGIIRTDVQSPPFVVYKEEIGFAGWIPVVESGISLYVFFPSCFVCVDVYTCKKFDYEEIKRVTMEIFKPKRIKEQRFLRGKEYVHPTELLKARGLVK